MNITKLKHIRGFCIAGAVLCVAMAAYNAWSFHKDAQEQQNVTAFIQEQRQPDGISIPVGDQQEAEVTAPKEPPNIDMEALVEVNQDIVGWVQIPGTNVNYPVMQSKDNKYYLEHSYTGEENSLGSIYMDFRVNVDNAPIYLLYGHNVAFDGNTMFSELTNYKDQAYGESHSSIYLKAGEEEGWWEVFAVCVADSTDTGDLEAYFATELPSQEDFDAYVENLKASAIYTLDGPQEINRLLVLTTCTEASSSSTRRIIVCAAPVEEG